MRITRRALARRLFGERGFAATTMDDIAGAARVAKRAVYHHCTACAEGPTCRIIVRDGPAVPGWTDVAKARVEYGRAFKSPLEALRSGGRIA